MKPSNGAANANGNGQEKNKNVVKPVITVPANPELSNTVVTNSGTTESNTNQEEKPVQLPPISDRFLRMDELYSLRLKWEKLNTSLEKLKQLQLASDGRNDNITLSDSKGNTFATSNPEVYKQMIEWLIADISKKLAETAALITL